MSKTSDIDLLLIGKTGNGKSALGNAILRSKRFEAMSTLGSVTDEITYGYTEFNGKTIKVVDGPGIGDTRLDQGVIKKIAEDVQEAKKVNPLGYHAILIVINFSCRFTAHDQGIIQIIKHMFGEEFLRRYCILVFTFGDMFERENAGKTIDQWCGEQDGEFKKVFDECDHRVVLFDNATEDEKKQKAQIEKLLEVVDSLPNQGQRYTDETFKLAPAARERVFEECKKPVVREETSVEASLILQNLDEVRTNFQDDEQIPQLKQLLLRVDGLIKSNRDQDMKKSLISLKKIIDDSILVQSEATEERKKKEEKEKNIRSRIDQEQQKIKDQLQARAKKNEKKRKETGAGIGSKHREMEEKQFRSKADTDRAAAERRRKVEDRETKARLSDIKITMQQKKNSTDSTIAQQKESVEGRGNIKQEFNKVRSQREEEPASIAAIEDERLDKLRQDQEKSQKEIDKLKQELKKIKDAAICVLL